MPLLLYPLLSVLELELISGPSYAHTQPHLQIDKSLLFFLKALRILQVYLYIFPVVNRSHEKTKTVSQYIYDFSFPSVVSTQILLFLQGCKSFKMGHKYIYFHFFKREFYFLANMTQSAVIHTLTHLSCMLGKSKPDYSARVHNEGVSQCNIVAHWCVFLHNSGVLWHR